MAVRSSIVTVGTTATPIAVAADQDNKVGRDVTIQNTSALTIYLGSPTVTTATGFPLVAGAGINFSGITADSLPSAVVEVGTATLAVLEVGV